MMARRNDFPNAVMCAILLLFSLITFVVGMAVLPSAQLTVDPGGSIRLYAQRAEDFTGPLPADCRSACTMYLARGCVTPAHRLIFHAPRPDTSYWRQQMADHYPPAIARWFMALPPGRSTYLIMGSEAIRLGARQCGP